MPKTGLRAINGYTRKMRNFVKRMAEISQGFTVIELISGTNVPYTHANAFLTLAHRRKELTRKKERHNGARLCYYYSASEKLNNEIVPHGEMANLVWEEMKNQFPERLTVPEIRRNINLRSGGDYNRCSIDQLARVWVSAGYLERVKDQSRTRAIYKYRIRPEFTVLSQRPVATNPSKRFTN